MDGDNNLYVHQYKYRLISRRTFCWIFLTTTLMTEWRRLVVELSSSAPDWPTSSASCLRSLPRAAHSSLRTTLSLLETLDEEEDEEDEEEEE